VVAHIHTGDTDHRVSKAWGHTPHQCKKFLLTDQKQRKTLPACLVIKKTAMFFFEVLKIKII